MAQYYTQKNATPTNKRMPLMFVLDVSGSMLDGPREDHPLLHMNKMVKDFLTHCLTSKKVSDVCDVSFLLFTDEILLESGFQPITELDKRYFPTASERHKLCGDIIWNKDSIPGFPHKVLFPYFEVSKADSGTNIGQAVLRAVTRIEERLKELEKVESYPAFMVLVTDGHPKKPGDSGYRKDAEAETKAIDRLLTHQQNIRDKNNLIAPIVINVHKNEPGEEDPLRGYTNHFKAGHFGGNAPVQWEFLASILAKSVSGSINLSKLSHLEEELEKARADVERELGRYPV